MSIVKRAGIDIWYDVRGDGPPLILTGGFAILHEQFHRVTPILAKSFKVVNWNYRGAGLSGRAQDSPLSLDDWVADLVAVCDELELSQAYFWSASTGALVHGRFAGLFPERVKAIIMYPELHFELSNRRRLYFYADVVEHFGWEGLAQIMALFLSPDIRCSSEGVAFAAWEKEVMERNFAETSLRRTVDVVAEADVRASLATLSEVPILLLAGDSGPLGATEKSFQQRVAEVRHLAPHMEVRVIPDTGGTYSMLENPAETARVVTEYLSTV